MKILHLSFYKNRGGAALCAKNLSFHLNNKKDVESCFYFINGDDVYESKNECALYSGVKCLYYKYRHNIFRYMFKLFGVNKKMSMSLNILPSSVINKVNELHPDVVHIHWYQNELFPLEDLNKIRAKLFFTLHDSWSFLGIEHHAHDDDYRYIGGYNQRLESESRLFYYLSKYNFYRKHKVFSEINANIICPSSWILNKAKRSYILSGSNLKLIHNPVCFVEPRKRFNATGRINILFGAASAEADYNKGYDLLLLSLDKIKNKDEFAIHLFGEESFTILPNGFEVVQHGVIKDQGYLRDLFAFSDVFVCPSRIENLPTVLIESISVGTPVVAFDVGGNSDIVNEITGCLAKPYDINELSDLICITALNSESFSHNCIEFYKEHFSPEAVVSQHLEYYQNA